jgi:hypothetical protein
MSERIHPPIKDKHYPIPPTDDPVMKLYRVGIIFPHAWKHCPTYMGLWYNIKWIAKYQWKIWLNQ